MLIDVHTHIVPEKLPDFAHLPGGGRWPRMEAVDPCHSNVMIAGRNFRTVTDQCWSIERRLEDMGREEVTHQVISPMPELFSYWFDPADTRDFCRYVNEQIAEMVQAAPQRFIGLGIVPLQSAHLAAREIEPIQALGLRGIEIGTNINGLSLADPQFLPFFQEAEARDMPLFVHALHPGGVERFTGPPILNNLIGFPQENTLAAATFITGGVIEKCPGLRLLFSHGGSGFAMVLPRLDQGWRTLDEFLPRPPSSYIGNFYFDTLLFDAAGIRLQMEKFGSHRLAVGSDYPFVIREVPPGKAVREIEDLTPADWEAISHTSALEFLGMERGEIEG